MSMSFGEGVETSGVWSVIGRLNPVAKLAITAIITIGLLITLDQFSSGVILIFEVLCIPFVGLTWRSVFVRVGILVIIAAVLTLTNALFSANTDGIVFFAWGPFSLSSAGLVAALAVGLRVLALSLPAVLLLSTTDPVLLADGLQQQLRVPARYAMSMVVGLRLMPLMASNWREFSAARRARGLAVTGPVTAVRSALERTVGLLIQSLRVAVRMATAMQARGFDPYGQRTFARDSSLAARDGVAVVLTLAVVALALYAAIARGEFTFALAWPF